MKSLKLNTDKFKKVAQDKHSTTMQHEDGHQIKIMHEKLSPKMRSELHALPLADGGPVSKEGWNIFQQGFNGENKDKKPAAQPSSQPVNKADGGEITKDDVPEPNKQAAKDFEKGATESKPANMSYWANLKEGFKPEPKVSPKPVSQDKYRARYAEGTPDEPVSQQDAQPQDNPPVAAPGTPINININGGMPNVPQQLANPNPGAQAMAKNPPIGQNVQDPSNLPYGVAPTAPNMPQDQSKGVAWAPPPSDQEQTPSEPNSAPQTQPDPFGTQAASTAVGTGLGQEATGILGEAVAQGKISDAQAKALQQNVNATNNLIDENKKHYNDLWTEYHAVMDDFKNQHVDPNRYLGSMDTGQKIKTVIGLILGGSGASDLLQKMIDRDVDAQKAELGKRATLLEANLKQFGNLKDATAMTTAMMNGMVANQLQLAAAQSGSAIAKSAALQKIGKLNQNSAQLIGSTAMRRTMLGGLASGAVDPARVVNFLIPEGQRAAANKELEESQNMGQARDNILSTFDKLAQTNTVGNRLTSPVQSSKQVHAMVDPIIAGLSKQTAGRFTESDAKMVGSLFPTPGDNDETRALKRAQLVKLITEKMHFPILESYGISPTGSGRFSNQGASRIQEAPPVIKR